MSPSFCGPMATQIDPAFPIAVPDFKTRTGDSKGCGPPGASSLQYMRLISRAVSNSFSQVSPEGSRYDPPGAAWPRMRTPPCIVGTVSWKNVPNATIGGRSKKGKEGILAIRESTVKIRYKYGVLYRSATSKKREPAVKDFIFLTLASTRISVCQEKPNFC